MWLSVPETGVMANPVEGKYMLFTDADRAGRIYEAIPHTQVAAISTGQFVVQVPLHDDSSLILSNLGVDMRGAWPFHFYYPKPKIEGLYDPMAHQSETAAFMATHKRCFCFNTMRTGKTGSLVMAFDYLQKVKGLTGSALIVSTVSTLGGVWERTYKYTLRHRYIVKIYGGSGKKDRLRLLNIPADAYVINYDGVEMIADELRERVMDGRITMVGLDEVTHYQNPSTARWKAMNSIINNKHRPCEYVCGMTGTPGGNLEGVFGMVKMVTPWTLGTDRKEVWKRMVMDKWGPKEWHWRPKPEANHIVKKVLQPQIRFDKKDIMDLPPVVSVQKDAALSTEQQKPYIEMLNSMVAVTQKGELISVASKAAMAHKLFQIALGAVIKENGEVAYLDNGPRLTTILETIEEAENKVVIFSVYKAAVERLTRQLNEKGIPAEFIHGGVTGGKRDRIFADFQNAMNPKVIVCHPMTTAFGVELSAADVMIFDGPPRLGEFIYAQALERLGSMKQRAAQISLVKLSATDEERECFKDIDNDVKIADSINRLFADLTARGKR